MSGLEQLITVCAAGLANMLCRFLPFALFSGRRDTPRYISLLGKTLPPAVFGMLVIYCLKDVSLISGSHGIPELIAILVTGGTYKWKRQMILSVASGTIVYMLLVQLVF